MSGYDYASRSGYDHSLGSRNHVTRVEAYVEEIRRPSVSKYKYPSSLVKVEPVHDYGRPREVDELITQILTEVNGAAPRSTHPNSGTDHWDRRSFPVKVESRRDSKADPWYSTSPTKVNPERDYPTGHDYGSAPRKSDYGVPYHSGRSPSHVYDQLPQRDYGSSENQWGRSSYPGYDHHPERDDSVPSNQWGHSPLKPETQKNHGVAPNNQWGGSPMKSHNPGGYRVPNYDNGAPKNHGVPPNNQWGASPTKPHTLGDYRAPNYENGVHKNHGAPPNNQWGASPTNSQMPGDYRVPNYENGVPKNHGVPPNNQWGTSTKSHTSGDYRAPNHDSGVPKNQWGSSPTKSKTQVQDYGVPSNLSRIKLGKPNDYEAPTNRWGSSPVKPQTAENHGGSKDHGVPKNQWGSSPMKSWTRQGYGTPDDHGALNNHWDRSPKKSQGFGNYEAPSNKQWDRSFSRDYDHSQSPLNLETPKEYPKKQWSDTFRDYGDPESQWDRPSSPAYDHLHNNRSPMKPEPWKELAGVPNNQWGNSPQKTQTRWDGGVPSNQWDKPSGPAYDNQQPPKATYSPYDEPKGNGNSHPINKPKDYPTNQHNGHGTDGWHTNPYTLDHQPKEYGSTNVPKPSGYSSVVPTSQTTTPLGKVTNNIRDALGQLTVSAGHGGLPEVAVGRSPRHNQGTPRAMANGDRRELGGHHMPSRAYTGGQDKNRTITSSDALHKYNGTFVPK